ncbi:MAG: PIN domain-containing protein [Lachnospiraceae bacterium]
MKNITVLVDTNVLLDYLTTRKPYFDEEYAILLMCVEEKINGYVAFHSIPDIYYILRKTYDAGTRREMLLGICNILTVTGASHESVISAVKNDMFKDLEDCLQDKCATEISADYIITRNISDYQKYVCKAITPKQFLDITGQL